MAPVPPPGQSAWQHKVDALRNKSDGPMGRYAEHSADPVPFIIQETGQTIQSRRLTLPNDSPVFTQLSAQNNPTSANLAALKYTADIVGNEPSDGMGYPLYIALHGGGEWTTIENDGQWGSMTNYYKGDVTSGVYCALRGIGDTDQLHSTLAGRILIERLIENMIMFGPMPDNPPKKVNPNKVYLLGFSAGGDGVYQLSPRLTQRFAAVNMSAGYPNNISLFNLMNVPICLQVGETDNGVGWKDSPLDRNYKTADYGVQLTALQKGDTNTYLHDVFIHPRGDHNNWEGDAEVIQDYKDWKDKFQLSTHQPTLGLKTMRTETRAVKWLDARQPRNPAPPHIVWDLNTKADGLSAPGQNYWLDIGRETGLTLGVDTIDAKISGNNIVLKTSRLNDIPATILKPIRLLLREGMMDLSKSVQVTLNGTALPTITPGSSMDIAVVQDTLARNDPFLIFTANIYVYQDGATWKTSTVPPPTFKSKL